MKPIISYVRITVALTVLLLSGLQMMGQNTNNEVIPATPPSPQAVAFNRLGDYQVNNNYGAPDINIPLFEIDYHGFKIPLALHYEATPMKSGYNYDVTGLGWTLSGNSCVSRTIKDRADEDGRFNNPFALDPFYNQSGTMMRYMDYADQLDQLNYQYDSYNIVLPSGRSIPFFMYKYGGVMQYNLLHLDRNVKISCSSSSSSIDSFTVIDENGVKYQFTIADKASNIYEDNPNALKNVTWLLTSIDIPSKGTITYQYADLQTINTYTVQESAVRVSRLSSDRQEDQNEDRLRVMKITQSQSPRYHMRFLRRIIYGPTQVVFNYDNDGLHMREIVVTDCGNTIKKFTLNMNPYGSIYATTLSSLVITGQNNTDRLEYDFSYNSINPGDYVDYWGNRCNPVPSFNNNGNPINNYGMDDLGNFNMFFDYDAIRWGWNEIQQQLSQNGMLAQLIENEPGDHSYYWKMKLQTTTAGDTRVPTPPERHGVLSSITYPNGGITMFSWENHRFPTATAADGDFVFDRRSQRIIEGGGFRIESITNYATDGTYSTDYYRYGFTIGDIIHRNFPLPLPDSLNISTLTFNDTINHHIGCGEAVVDPNLLTFMTYSHATTHTTPYDFHRMLLGLPSSFSNISNSSSPTWWDAVFSTNNFRSLLGGRRPVVYPEITVYHGQPYEPEDCISKTVYRYDIYDYQLGPYSYYLSQINQSTSPDTAYFEPVYYRSNTGLRCMEQPAKRHQLKSKSDYSYNAAAHTWNLVSEETYSYSEDEKSESGFIFESDVSRGHCGSHTLQLGAGRPLESFSLRDFYQDISQKIGRSTLIKKYTTTLRQNGTRTDDNTLVEDYSYLYSGILRHKYYTDGCYKADEYSYAEDGDSTDPVIAEMLSKNMLASVTTVETYPLDWPSVITGSKIGYGFFGNNILPYKLYERNGNNYEASVKVLSYDSYGNPTEIVDLKTGNEQTGIHSVFLWDTYGRYLIAVIKNATLSQVGNASQLLTMTSWARRATLQSLLPNAQIQTWDYLPLIGVSSHTDVNGQTILYEYDGLGRLKYEKRRVNGVTDPEILREYEYNYRNNGL